MELSFKSIAIAILAIGLVCFAEPWTADLTLTDGSYTLDLTFGRLDGALDLLDGEDDVLAIPPPTGSYAYFELDDPANPYITMLYGDIRPDDGDSALWVAHLISAAASLDASWIPALLPPGDFHIGAHYPLEDVTEWVNMKEVATLDYSIGMVLDIVHDPDGYYPEDSPVFSNWYPYDGATAIPVTGTIRFDVTDEGSGIDPASIEMTVDGADVSAEIELSPIEGGYRVTYDPPSPLHGESWISVIVSAADNAYVPNVSSDVIAFRTGYSIEPVLWEIPLTAYNIDGTDTGFSDISLGADPDAEATFDMGYDILFPMAPPTVFYAFFPLDDPDYPFYTMLSRDIRSSDLFFDEWPLRFGNTDDIIGVKWETDDIPSDKDAFIAVTFISVYPEEGDWWDMTVIDHIDFGPGRQAWIKVLSPSGDTLSPQVVFTDPADGETGVAVSTEIWAGIVDAGGGVDPTSITMLVDGVDASPYLIISHSSETTFVRYIPSADFDPLHTAEVTIGVDDLADPPNHADYTWHFVTGYFLTPAWMGSLFVWTDEPEEPLRHFSLFFGADSMATDSFDYGLDQQQPPAPPGDTPYGFFQIEDDMWGRLSRDIRSSEDDDIMWVAMMMRIPVDDEIDSWIDWDSDCLPEDGSFHCAWWITGDTVWENMRTTDRVDISTPGIFLIHFTRGVPPTYCVAGTVQTDEGVPIEGASVWISEELNAISDSIGFYEICGVTIGEWTIITSLEDYSTDSTNIYFDADQMYNPVLYPVIVPSATVHGMISCSDGGDPEGAMVILDGDTTYADSTGYYAFEEVPDGIYTMFVSLEYYVTQEREISVDAPDITEDFVLDRQVGRIVGTITLSDDPPNLSGTAIELIGTSIPAVYTNSDGEYLISDVPFGEYDVRISRTSYVTLDTTFTLLVAEDTLDAELQSEFVLNPPRNLAGRTPYDMRVILEWDEPEASTAHLEGYNAYRQVVFSDDTLLAYIPDPYTEFVEWDRINFMPYTYLVTAVYSEGESEPISTTTWLNPDSSTADILIWDYDNGALLANQGDMDEAEFLRQRISVYDLEVAVTSQDQNLPDVDFFAYRAIILLTGIDDDTDAVPSNPSINRLTRYIVAGGRVYSEGADFGYDFGREASPTARKNLFRLFGATYAADGYTRTSGNVQSLLGENTSFFREGVVNIGYDFQGAADQRIDEWDTTEIAEGTTWAMFSQDDPAPLLSPLRMVYREMYAWKTVLSSVYIGAMNDIAPPSTRQYVIAAILNFLLGTDYRLIEESKYRLPENLAIAASPNPFNAASKLSLEIDEPGRVVLTIFDITGRPVTTLSDGYVAAGFYSATWDGTSISGTKLPSGIYFAILKHGDRVVRTNMTLIK